jgi:hypothetical protein
MGFKATQHFANHKHVGNERLTGPVHLGLLELQTIVNNTKRNVPRCSSSNSLSSMRRQKISGVTRAPLWRTRHAFGQHATHLVGGRSASEVRPWATMIEHILPNSQRLECHVSTQLLGTSITCDCCIIASFQSRCCLSAHTKFRMSDANCAHTINTTDVKQLKNVVKPFKQPTY